MGMRLSLSPWSLFSPGSAVVTLSVGLLGGDSSVYETTDGAGEQKVEREGTGVTYGVGGREGEVELLGVSSSVGGKGQRQIKRNRKRKRHLQNLLVAKKLFKYVKWHKRFLKQVKSAYKIM